MNTIRIRTALLGAVAALGLAQQAQAQAEPFIGQVMCAGFNFAPRGWAAMNGQLLPIATNTALFSLLGTTYGGDGRVTFGLPDMRGRVMIHTGMGPGLTFRNLGEQGGTENQTLSASQMPPHSHSVAPAASSDDANSISPTGKAPATKARTSLYADATPGNTMAPTMSSVAGGGQPFNNMQPFVTMNCFIATEGIFPSRP
ncbi:tail fiber protein [Pelomonas sp. APW6]|uniref:Tail fiber protein n=1 Tax=Roseateles subflavus TaxID=3053353 RepID=A0ABT7LIU1_9BURK|nr:tail fiber protein [Pelomonas sp. APW6]MDL5031436.1 tail fiber protein [Pelomonas sp. APW6]